ncbi:hypothetical protein GCM10027280_59080 [Micromonospora polyrhachis]|uniref:Uncharacterized protein n=1 Tax=Micromonospora polyrhachis TaxID=1282883 RepID=A0A7W7SSL6_9ACTN|nr:hypothetical protein [Micromonospora polyrhachis]MBB4959592.1 hypothetical protein [Micromonospora polyrhachis]
MEVTQDAARRDPASGSDPPHPPRTKGRCDMTLNPDYVVHRPTRFRLALRNRWGSLRLGTRTRVERIDTTRLLGPPPPRRR